MPVNDHTLPLHRAPGYDYFGCMTVQCDSTFTSAALVCQKKKKITIS